MKKLIKFFRPVIINLMRAWWFITRPKTRGVKIILLHDNQVLLIKNTYGYKWILPGGGVHKTEGPEQAAKREALEELGITVEELNPLQPFTTYEEYKEDTVYSFYSTVLSKQFTITTFEVDRAEWFPLSKLPEMGSVSSRILKDSKLI